MVGRAGKLVLVALVAVGGLVAIPATGSVASGPCSATATQTLTGAQGEFTSTVPANSRIDANGATWAPSATLPYPVYFDSTADTCWEGGRITGTFPISTTWAVYHDTAGIGVSGTNVTIDHPRIFNVGDGIRIRDNADGFLIKDAYESYVHDDCVENDRLVNGTIDHSLLDGCYVGISTRRSDGTTYDGHLNTVTISNSLIRLQAMPTVYSGSAAGHGGFFKWDTTGGTSPKLNISNTIFRADQDTNHQDLNLPSGYSATCSNNIMVWLGPGAFPGSPTSCWSVTTDRSVWDNAVRAWDIVHPGVITGPEVSVGDASMVEGTSGTRTFKFPISLSSPPGAGKTVTVYWATAPGTATTSNQDFKFAKGKLTFTGSQTLKPVTITVTPDGTAEGNELMYLVAAGVDGGENHRERGTGTIVNDDIRSTEDLVVSDATVVEGDSGTRTLQVPVALTYTAPADVIFHWSTVGTGSATAGADYVNKSGTVKIKQGQRMAIVSVPLLPDTVSESNETFQIVVDSATNANRFDPTGVVTIRDDD
ncbi:MAG: Calx-beta domain-containing protein [Acidimicrobiia bacterium]